MLPKIILVTLIGLTLEVTAQPSEYEGVSLINLIATPERFEQRKVAVSGWLSLELENMSLCIADRVPSRKECLWIEFEHQNQSREEFEKQLNQWKQHDKRLVMVHGTFDKSNKGHFGAWSGALDKIIRISPIPRR